ncbi:MAG: hypothetical protein EPN45_05205 [Rhizobiaceae bacterium]|nr:MAG: hypothetical protein EPN45_05205 [Rhizobiaceae bacterium]
MSAHAISSSPAFQLQGLSHTLRAMGRIFTRRSALSRDIEKLSDHLLVDIGVDPRAVSHSGRDAADALQLIECGWRSPSRGQRP